VRRNAIRPDQTDLMCWQPDWLKIENERCCRAGRGRTHGLPYGRLLQKRCFCFFPWSTATETTKQSMRRPKARNAGTLAAAESIPRQWEAGLDREPDHNAVKRTKASTHTTRPTRRRCSRHQNAWPRQLKQNSQHKRQSKQKQTTTQDKQRKEHCTPGQCERAGSAEPSKRPVGRKHAHSWPVRRDGVDRAIQTPGRQEARAAGTA